MWLIPQEPGAEERTLVPSSSGGSSETLPGSALGTPAYMSPEQARGELDRLGPRSDVYSLGATLHCLLTGKPPLEGEDLGEMLRRVQSGELPTPRQVDASIDRALEAVCLRAMAAEPKDRHATAHALAEDVERWMADEPVSAWREPVSRRALRWLTRHRTGVTAAGVALLVALAGTAAVLAVQTSANAELRRANERERQRFDLAMEAIKLFHGEVSQDLLLKEKQFQGLRSKLLKGAADFYGKLERLLEGQLDRASRAALGRAYFELGNLTGEIGNAAEALAAHRKGLAVLRKLAREPEAGAEAVLDLVRSLNGEGGIQHRCGDSAGAFSSYGEARALVEGLVAAGRGGDEAKALLAEALMGMGWPEANHPESLELLRLARPIAEELVGKHPGVARYLEDLGTVQNNIGVKLTYLGREAESLAAYKENAITSQRLVNAQPEEWRYHNHLAVSYSNIAASFWGQGRLDEAVGYHRKAVAVWRKAADANPAARQLENDKAYGMWNLAQCLIDSGRPVEALELLSQARSSLRRLLELDRGAFEPRINMARALTTTGEALARSGRLREAEVELEQASSDWQRLADDYPTNGVVQTRLAEPYTRMGQALRKAGRTAEVVKAHDRSRTIRRRLEAAGPVNAAVRGMAARCETTAAAALLASDRLAEARECCDRAIAIGEELARLDPENHGHAPGLAESLLRSGSVRKAGGDLPGAAALWRRAAALYADHPPHNEPAILHACCHGALASLAGKAGSVVAAEEGPSHAEQAMAILQRVNASGYRDPDLLRIEPGLDPFRSRDDFRLLMMDQVFPAEPFVTAR